MWREGKEGSIEYYLFEKGKWIKLPEYPEPFSLRYLEMCKKDMLLFNIDCFVLRIKDKALAGTKDQQDGFRKLSLATEYYLDKSLKQICRNVVKGRPVFEIMALLDERSKQYSDMILSFCHSEK